MQLNSDKTELVNANLSYQLKYEQDVVIFLIFDVPTQISLEFLFIISFPLTNMYIL